MKFEEQLFRCVADSLKENRDPVRAVGQQKYMKSKLPFWGIQMPGVRKITNEGLKKYPIKTNTQYRDSIRYFFKHAQKREEWYAAMHFSQKQQKFITESNLDIFLELVLIAQWWDIVDGNATRLIGPAIKKSNQFAQYIISWIKHENFWMRRTAILSQLNYKLETDEKLLYSIILQCTDEKEFFIRKAIGWALREYAKTNPINVINFVENNSNILSNLTKREALKNIGE